MKVLSLHELGIDDRLRLTLESSFSHHGNLEAELAPFIQTLEAHAGDWMPEIVRGSRNRKYTRASVWKALVEQRDETSASVALYRAAPPAVELCLDLWLSPQPAELSVWLDIQPTSCFSEVERSRRFVDMVHEWATQYPVHQASAHSMADRELAGFPHFGREVEVSRRDGFDKVYEVCWLNIFGPKLVETVGRERVLSTPAHRVEELPNGSVLLVLRPTAADFASDEARVAQARAHVHLRPDLDFDTVLRILRERSAALASVEPRFHPDLTPLLSRLPDEVVISARQRKIAELNAFQPPEPEEWLPVALPPDVENPERYKRDLIDSHTAPALGGTWIPRQNPEESQVRVGQRVWLPFLRARRYMESRQSLLTHSLTQFFREAERHRS
ncbi:hypothetical protein HJC10_05775 [Corallococcus exiguus]|nr:hypothetical protein [Corallococcus exiguus]